jgi:hypothetical protein
VEAEQIRVLLFEFFRDCPDAPLNFDRCAADVAYLAVDRYPGLLNPDARGHSILSRSAKATLGRIIWDLILSRVLIPGGDSPWPHLAITEHGRKVVGDQQPVPYDPEGYLKRLFTESPNLHPTTVRYVREAVDTFRGENYLASVVMLGAAAEKLFTELAASLPEKLTKGKKLAAQVTSIMGWCTRNRKLLPPPWHTEEHADDINQIATFIRRRRNDAGHPQDPPAEPSMQQMYAYLMVFPDYCKHIYQLKTWADANRAALPP